MTWTDAFYSSDFQWHLFAWYTGALGGTISIILSLRQIHAHLCLKYRDKIRKHVIRILMMVPLYSLESWLGLRFVTERQYFEAARDMYESFVIYSFFKFLVTYLGGEELIVESLNLGNEGKELDVYKQAQPPSPTSEERKKRASEEKEKREVKDEATSAQDVQKEEDDSHVVKPHKHVIPFCCVPPWNTGQKFFTQCKWGILSYVYVKFGFAVLQFCLLPFDLWQDGVFKYNSPYAWSSFFNNCTQIWALYCLALFYLSNKNRLKPIKPVPKFMSIKLIVFFTYWQSVAIAVGEYFGYVQANGNYSQNDVAAGIQDYLICWEMLLAAIAHIYIFPPSDFVDPEKPGKKSPYAMLCSAFNLADSMFGPINKELKKRRERNRRDQRLADPMQVSINLAAPVAAQENANAEEDDDEEEEDEPKQEVRTEPSPQVEMIAKPSDEQ